MDQEIRNKLRNVVTQCRRLLEDAITQELEGKYSIFAKKDQVTADPNAEMKNLTSQEDREARKDILDHLEHIKARGFKPKDALEQLIREIAFTHLNRLCAYKMMEAREVYVGGQKFREAVSRGVNSNGVKFYLAEHPEEERLFNTGHQDVAYRHFLDWLGGLLSDEIGVLFNPNDPANRLYPRQKTLDEVLDLLNGGGIKAEETELREQWPQIWSQDETIGWVYQYFTPKELREASKDPSRGGSEVPRNSYELAFRNQFFTPRYVVEFLTDNTLGRIWYEMRKGDTKLKDQCRYMVRRPTEIFLKDGEQLPKDAAEGKDDLSQEELLKLPVHIPHRPKKDPRELKILDPACGSGHFLLYCFDLLLTIYEEAYADPDLGPALKKDYPTLDALQRDVPRLILAHNLHGIDIDLRASQIAALALWLRCQRAYQGMGFKKDRPQITRSNVVCAEPMPGEEQMLEEFVGQLEPKVLGQVVKVVFDKMKLAGEAGSLLKIDEQIRDSIAAAKKQYVRETTQATDRKGQPLLFTQAAMDRLAGKPDQPLLFDLSDITDNQFFEVAEARVAETLRHFAEKAQSNMKFQRRLFSDDALRGFAFVDICHKRFDAILMNPPFGEATPDVKTLCNGKWSDWNSNILCAFMHCMWDTVSSDGAIGVIFDRTASVKATYESFRRSSLCSPGRMLAYVDLGWGVLDANVETAMAVLSRRPVVNSFCGDVRYSEPHEKESCLTDTLKAQLEPHFKVVPSSAFTALPNAIVGYDFPSYLLKGFQECPSLEDAGFKAYSAHTLKADKHNRVWWEVSQHNPPPFSQPMFNGSGYSPYSTSFREVAIAECEPYSLPRNSTTILRNRDVHGRPGVCFSKRGDVFCCHIAPAGMLFTQEGRPLPVKNQDDAFHLLALLNTPLFRFALNKVCGQHKSGGYLNMLPFRRLGENGIVAKVRDCLREANLLRAWDETQPQFAASFGCGNNSLGTLAQNLAQSLDAYRNQVSALEQECEAHARHAYQISELDKQHLDEFATQQPRVELPIEDISHSKDTNKFVAQSLLSFALGVAFGRWDVRKSIFERDGALGYEPFDPLPIFPPALLVQRQESLAGYPCEIQWDGILVDAEESQDDLIGRVHSALEVMFGNHSDHVVAEACDILGVSNLREYFRRSGRGGFWEDHVSRYTKSRRRAPIYWLLQSKSKRLSVWLYYQRIDGDTLLKVLRPAGPLQTRIGVEENKLEELRRQKQRASDSSKEGKRLACDIESQDEAVSELRDFEMKLRRVANLHLEVDLNDGVVLNIAPLWELVPWKEAKKYWDELMEGKYEWSSIGKQLREKGLVK